MPTAISIKDRILRQIRTDMESVTGVQMVVGYSFRGRWYDGANWVERLPRDSMVVLCQSDDPIEQAIGDNSAPVTKRMRVACGMLLRPDEDDTTSHDTLLRRWEALMENQARATPFVYEGSVQLAVNSDIVDAPEPETAEGQREFIPVVTIQVDYMHDRDDPTAMGSAIVTTYDGVAVTGNGWLFNDATNSSHALLATWD